MKTSIQIHNTSKINSKYFIDVLKKHYFLFDVNIHVAATWTF